MKRLFLLLILILAIASCVPVVTFNQPQPEGVDSLTVIPRKLFGQYLAKNGGGLLNIDRNFMILHYDYDVKQPKDSIDWTNLTPEEKSKYRVVGDSVIEHITDVDTLFRFSEDNVLKKFKGYYFLNSIYGKHSWMVHKLKLEKGLLTIGSISTKEELKTLDKINESPIDTTTYQIKFTRKQFHEYIDNEGFSKVDTFIRIRPGKNTIK